MAPETEAQTRDFVATCYTERKTLRIYGGDTKRCLLRETVADTALSVRGLSGICFYSPEELVISAGPGTTLAELRATLAARGQRMAFEPPDWTALLGSAGTPTIGGVIATNLSGPRRIAQGAARDHVLGLRAINGRGEVLRAGGRVLKNVTGLDLCKVFTGSHGTLAVITEVTLKVLPAPPCSASVLVRNVDATGGVAALSAALGSPFGVSGAAYLPDNAIAVVRLEDAVDSVAYRGEKLCGLLARFGDSVVLPQHDSVALWSEITEAAVLQALHHEALWQVSVRPSRGPAVLAVIAGAGARGFLDWGGGRVMIAGPATRETHDAVTAAAQASGGVWMLLRGDSAWRQNVDVLPPEPPALRQLSQGLKNSFDPAGILNSGRMTLGQSDESKTLLFLKKKVTAQVGSKLHNPLKTFMATSGLGLVSIRKLPKKGQFASVT